MKPLRFLDLLARLHHLLTGAINPVKLPRSNINQSGWGVISI